MHTLRFALFPSVLIGLVLASSEGCAKKDIRPQRVAVSGTVLRKGEPMADATVLFDPVGGTPAAIGKTDASGRFRLTTFDSEDGAVPGEYKVAVRKVEVLKTARPETASDDFAATPPDEKWLLPAFYGNSATSGFSATVRTEGENNFKFELAE